MRPDRIRELLRATPFQPIRVFLSDGSSYDVRHPELALVTRRHVLIALPLENDRLPERYVTCDPLHITRIEPLEAA